MVSNLKPDQIGDGVEIYKAEEGPGDGKNTIYRFYGRRLPRAAAHVHQPSRHGGHFGAGQGETGPAQRMAADGPLHRPAKPAPLCGDEKADRGPAFLNSFPKNRRFWVKMEGKSSKTLIFHPAFVSLRRGSLRPMKMWPAKPKPNGRRLVPEGGLEPPCG